MKKVMSNRIPDAVTKETVASFAALLAQARALVMPTPIVEDDEFNSWEKMGPVRYEKAKAKIAVLKLYSDLFTAPLSVEAAANYLSVYEYGDEFIALLQEIIDDFKRLKGISGALGWNMVTYCEKEVEHRAGQNFERSFAAMNALGKPARSTSKKGSKKGVKKNPPPIA